jgi:hypothetical protein
VGHAHLLTLLWHRRRRTPDALRRSVTAWAPMYAAAIVAMSTLFWAADLTGPAHPERPLSFAISYAHVPAALACELVYLAALVAGIVATVGQCRGPDGVISLPERPELARSLTLFAAAVALDLAYVACTAAAVLAASRGEHRLDFLAGLGSIASSSSALVASYGLAKPALAARAAERCDHERLRRLWETVIAAPGAPAPRRAGWWNSRYALTDLIVDILDGIRALHPWMSPAPAQAVADLSQQTAARTTAPEGPDEARTTGHSSEDVPVPGQSSEPGEPTSRPTPAPGRGPDLTALKAAASLRYAHWMRGRPGAPPSSGEAGLLALAESGIPATRERALLVQVARHLHPPDRDRGPAGHRRVCAPTRCG